ncbi:hypothetical protein [Kribbella solani]|uniref:Uncharacterized protein n=1 Tax=Kribbella solani TaxID=236067 RepID=A0A841DJC5_9ACTN|nr:hypothetical protein [Kribbella solani]MBB5978612.1 hypothetical protein [Kribbella solani]MDX2970593.1 hypothetical protein [Kribbella solani]MDX3004953.1 hypothetical protein [Kribbella solani]
MAFAVARTRDEAQLYLELHPCPDCGSDEADWEQSLVRVNGELHSQYAAVCPGCSAEREYLFGLPEHETPVHGWPTFGGPEPSEILDAGQWLDVADRAASDVPTDPAEAGKVLAVAYAAVVEVIKFVPAGRDAVPEDEFWTPEGQAVLAAEPGRFRLERLLIARDTYQELGSDIGDTGAR